MRRGRGPAIVVALVLMTMVPVTRADEGRSTDLALMHLPDAAQPQIDDPISEAELEDLTTLADQKGMSLQAAIDRYAWNDNFALAIATVRQSSPEAFTGAEIVDGGTAWVAFAASVPDRAIEIIDKFTKAHDTVMVDVRSDFGFTEVELEKAIETFHYAVLEAASVREASTSFDFDTRQITTVVALDAGAPDSVLDDLRAAAVDRLVDTGLGGILDDIATSVIRSGLPVLGGTDDNGAHIGGENLSGACTSGFVVKNAAGTRGVSTAGHCGDPLTDDGAALVFKAEHIGQQGDFQWHTGPQGEPDDFYAGDANATEVNRRCTGTSLPMDSTWAGGMTQSGLSTATCSLEPTGSTTLSASQ